MTAPIWEVLVPMAMVNDAGCDLDGFLEWQRQQALSGRRMDSDTPTSWRHLDADDDARIYSLILV